MHAGWPGTAPGAGTSVVTVAEAGGWRAAGSGSGATRLTPAAAGRQPGVAREFAQGPKPVCRLFPGWYQQVPLAREFAGRCLAGHGPLAEPTIRDVLLCVTELATNAVEHTRSGFPGGIFAVTVTATVIGVRAEVIDQGPAGYVRSPASGLASRGHPAGDGGDAGCGAGKLPEDGMGLLLVAGHCWRHGYEMTRFGGRDCGRSWVECLWEGP
ncbi:MAG TPA: ATP-binding protein [Streptosporangiaceae bacterium]|nr:ATP-binding protein [Streptosporangiaceae bacterium]